jgi:hypothetical protein
MPRYHGVDGVAREVKKRYLGVGGIAREIAKSYVGVDGIARQFFKSGPIVAELPVGSSVFMQESGGIQREYIVVHQGIPDETMYDASCDGTWLLCKSSLSDNVTMVWEDASTLNDYKNSRMHCATHGRLSTDSLSSGNLRGVIDSTKEFIKQVRIPYVDGPGDTGTLASGSSGLLTYSFLLSGLEVGFQPSEYMANDGVCLDYFAGSAATDSIRICKSDSIAKSWYLRTPRLADDDAYVAVNTSGGRSYYTNTNALSIRPALILDYQAPFDPETNVLL